jgi:hypothetical protein
MAYIHTFAFKRTNKNTKRRNKMNIDFKSLNTDSPEMVPVGTYKVSLFEVERKEASTKTPQLVWKVKVVEGPYKDQELRDYTALTEAAAWRIKIVIEGFGLDLSNLNLDTDSPAFEKLLAMCNGRESLWQVIENPGYSRNKIGFHNPTSNETQEVLPEDLGEQSNSPYAEGDVPFGSDSE